MKESTAEFVIPHRDRVVPTVHGHVFAFKKGEPLSVPYSCWEIVQAAGAVPVAELPDSKPPSGDAPVGEERELLIMAAFEQLVASGDRNAFTAGGLPNIKALERAVGFDVDSNERDDLWAKFNRVDPDKV